MTNVESIWLHRRWLRWLTLGTTIGAAVVTAFALRFGAGMPLAPAQEDRFLATGVVGSGATAPSTMPNVPKGPAEKGARSADGGGRGYPPVAARPQVSEPRLIGDYTEAEHQVFKESYYCELAQEARAACGAAGGDEEAYERCLSLRSYYTYSRHCGYRP